MFPAFWPIVFHFAQAKQKWKKLQKSMQARFLRTSSPDSFLPDRFACRRSKVSLLAGYLDGCYKTTSTGVEAEWKLCLYWVGLIEEAEYSHTICLLLQFPCEMAHDNTLSMVDETHAPIWPQHYHPLSLTMNGVISCHSLWTCSYSFIPFNLVNDIEVFWSNFSPQFW